MAAYKKHVESFGNAEVWFTHGLLAEDGSHVIGEIIGQANSLKYYSKQNTTENLVVNFMMHINLLSLFVMVCKKHYG